VKRIGHVALMSPDWFYYLYENPKQEAEDSLFDYLSKSPQFNKKPIDYYDVILIPAELEEHWILLVIDNDNKDIGVYDSNMKTYPDICKIMNKFLKSQGINQKYPILIICAMAHFLRFYVIYIMNVKNKNKNILIQNDNRKNIY
uniref:Ulp1 family isopeptidase n=1 Tax=uncultured Brachyspira sp. TaxID=221953 RepID=UPI0025E70401